MSTVTVDQIKQYLRITHNSDDAMLQLLIDGAEDEALVFLNRDLLPRRNDVEFDSNDAEISDSDDIAPVVRMGIYLIVQGMYEGKDANEMEVIRHAAEVKWMPYRANLGV